MCHQVVVIKEVFHSSGKHFPLCTEPQALLQLLVLEGQSLLNNNKTKKMQEGMVITKVTSQTVLEKCDWLATKTV